MTTKFFSVILLVFVLISMIPHAEAYSLSYDTAKNNVSSVYDGNNRVVNQSGVSNWIRFVYDLGGTRGKITNASNSEGVSVNYTYDREQRVVREIKQIDGYSFEKNIYYDSMDRPLVFRGTFNEINIGYGHNGLINAISQVASFVYNQNGQITRKDYQSGAVTDLAYDNVTFRIRGIETGNKQNLSYTYDRNGNIVAINDSVNGRNLSMSYDQLNRLISVSIISTQSNNIIYEYNSIGNIISANSSENNISYIYTLLAHAPSSIDGLTIGPQDSSKLIIRNSTNGTVAWFGNQGNIVLRGNCTVSNCNSFTIGNPPKFIVKNSSGKIVASVDGQGNLCVSTGSCSAFGITCNPVSDAVIIRDANAINKSYILNNNGTLCYTGTLYQNSAQYL